MSSNQTNPSLNINPADTAWILVSPTRWMSCIPLQVKFNFCPFLKTSTALVLIMASFVNFRRGYNFVVTHAHVFELGTWRGLLLWWQLEKQKQTLGAHVESSSRRHHNDRSERSEFKFVCAEIFNICSFKFFLWGYSLAYSNTGSVFIGDLSKRPDTSEPKPRLTFIFWFQGHIVLTGVGNTPNAALAPTIPHNCYMIFQK